MRKVLLAILSSTITLAQLDNTESITKTGTTAAQFLKIGVDARASAMGNAFTAMSGDISSMYWNPAGLAYVGRMETMFVNSNWLAGINFNYTAFAINLNQVGVIGFSITNLSVPDDLVRTVEKPNGTGEYFGASDLAMNICYARQLTNRFSIGGNIKYIRQNIWHASTNSFAADLGALFITPFNDIRLGASLSNYGTEMQMSGRDQKFSIDPDPNNEGNVEFVNAMYETDKFPLPLLFRVGLSGEIIQNEKMRLSFAVDALHPNDNVEWINAGLEYAIAETFFLRGGMTTLFREDTEEGLTFGGGINYRIGGTPTQLKVDYSYSAFGRLKNVQRISFGIRF
ncbi:MAG: PorV/PorQ family protein [Candidatus Marinimicrobia bacterium]|nr:PorV/PorQ family protein [Candidatus Neomarinimicrobiota bacterium]